MLAHWLLNPNVMEREPQLPFGSQVTPFPFSKKTRLNPLAMDKITHPDKYIYMFDMPGFLQKDITLQLVEDGRVLVVEGKRSTEYSSGNEGVMTSQRTMGRFHQSLPLDPDTLVDEMGAIQAKLDNGVLSVVFPRMLPPSLSDSGSRRSIPIQ